MTLHFKPLHVIKQTNVKHSGLVIFFHGSGDTGTGIKEWVKFLLRKDLEYPHLQVVYPTAPQRPYTPLNGRMSNVWFDRKEISPFAPEHKESIDKCAENIVHFIKEIADDIPLNRIIIGGFSMGGCLSLHLAYRFLPEIAGVFSLSSFLSKDSAVYEELKSENGEISKNIPLFMCHGDKDDLVPIHWGEDTRENLEQRGVNLEFVTLENTFHELKTREIKQLSNWILKILPPLPNDT